MRIRRNAQERGPGRSGRAGGLVMKGKTPEGPSIIQRRKAEAVTFDQETHVQCDLCFRVVRRRRDGTMMAHRSSGTIPCLGSAPRVP